MLTIASNIIVLLEVLWYYLAYCEGFFFCGKKVKSGFYAVACNKLCEEQQQDVVYMSINEMDLFGINCVVGCMVFRIC